MKYDPEAPPDPHEWLALDEGVRLECVTRYHQTQSFSFPNPALHNAIHVVVETQIAMGEELPVASVLDRLRAEGLSRHDALHAIGAVLANHLVALQRGEEAHGRDPSEGYYAELGRLTRKSWLAEYG